MKKLVSVLLVLVLLLSTGLVSVFAQEQSQYLFKDKFKERYGSAMIYHEILIGYENNEVAWAFMNAAAILILVDPNPGQDISRRYKNDDIIISSYYLYEPFETEYCIYDVALDEFIDITTADLDKYEGVEDYLVREGEAHRIGDMNYNGEVNIADATLMQRVLAQLDDYNMKYLIYIDYNNDGVFNILDATAIQRMLAKLDLPVGEDAIYTPYNQSTLIFSANHTEHEIMYQGIYEESDHNIDCDYYAILIKSSQQYNQVFNVHNDVYDDAFFEENWLVAVVTPVLNAEDVEDVYSVYLEDGTIIIATYFGEGEKAMGNPEAVPSFTFFKVNKYEMRNVFEISWW